ncbi:hypothetical protein Aazo_1641 ['Nostoc azollae' 0708]|jgi:hypothetical protein|uniref:Uncharacterized protein n=1 Tax=Nostoc azollae (strain 0708) TaxID=551115 RepID=D7E513_NOSA0|nr:hypothetical protein Aazo_1641 ['Nostoc azollae' 0708]
MEVLEEKKSSKPKTVTSVTMSLGNEVVTEEISGDKSGSANNKTQTISNGDMDNYNR